MNWISTPKTSRYRHLETADLVVKFALTILALAQSHGDDAALGAKITLLGGTALLQLARGLMQMLSVRYKPPSQQALTKFAKVVRHSQCPFACKAKLLGMSIDLARPVVDQVIAWSPAFAQFTKDARKRKMDGIVMELRTQSGELNLRTFCSTFNAILRTLAAADPTGMSCFRTGVLAPHWQFSFNRMRFFITTFAPFYHDRHARFSHSKTSAFIYFQPEFSFDQHGIHARNPQRALVKKSIRRDFIAAGSELDVALIEQPHEALKYIKPLRAGGPPVRWWEVNASATR
jgi:hypothetical protein